MSPSLLIYFWKYILGLNLFKQETYIKCKWKLDNNNNLSTSDGFSGAEDIARNTYFLKTIYHIIKFKIIVKKVIKFR